MNIFRAALLVTVACLVPVTGCALAKKKISAKTTYPASFMGSTDGITFHSVLQLMDYAQVAKPACRAINRKNQLKANYLVDRKDSGINITVKDCESAGDNCANFERCVKLRPVAWMARASGRGREQPGQSPFAGLMYTDWLGRCGGSIAVRFYYGPQGEMPIERVGCAEPQHDEIDTAYEMFLVPRTNAEDWPAAAPYIEALLSKWNKVVFHELDEVPLPQ